MHFVSFRLTELGAASLPRAQRESFFFKGKVEKPYAIAGAMVYGTITAKDALAPNEVAGEMLAESGQNNTTALLVEIRLNPKDCSDCKRFIQDAPKTRKLAQIELYSGIFNDTPLDETTPAGDVTDGAQRDHNMQMLGLSKVEKGKKTKIEAWSLSLITPLVLG